MIPYPHIDRDKLPEVSLQIGRLTELPAGHLDLMALEEPSFILGNLLKELRKRFFYIVAVPPCLCIDILSNLCLSLSNTLRVLLYSDDCQEEALTRLKEHSFLFSKSLFSLTASIIGLIEPTWIGYFFNPQREKEFIQHSGGDINHKALQAFYPKTREELQQTVIAAIKNKQKISIRGAGFSQGEQYLNGTDQAILIDLKYLNDFEIINDKEHNKKYVRANGGCRWGDIQTALNKKGLALKVMQASNIFSVAGSLSTNIHGWDHHSGTLSQTVKSIEIINAEGEFQTVRADEELFDAICGGFGLFGLIVNVTFEVQDNIPLIGKTLEVAPQNFMDFFDEHIRNNEKVKMFRYRLSIEPNNLLKQGFVSHYEVMSDKPEACVTENFKQEGDIGTRRDRIFANMGKHLDFVRKQYWQNEINNIKKEEQTSTNGVMQPEMNAMFNNSVSESEWLQEYFLPKETLEPFINELSEILEENKTPLINCSIRYVKENPKGVLSYAPEERFAVVICFNQPLSASEIKKTGDWINQAAQKAVEKGGTYYLPYQQVASTSLFDAAYGAQVKRFRRLKEMVDPNEVFYSGFYHKYLRAALPVKRLDYKALLENKNWAAFSSFVSAVLKRLDLKKFKLLLTEVCQHCKNEDDIYSELQRRLPEISSSSFTDLRQGLKALSSITRELTEQATALVGDRAKPFSGYLEIGYPGRYITPFKKAGLIQGKSYVLCHGQTMMDYLEAGIPRPYDEFLPLDDLNPAKFLARLPNNSVELISCFYGLHHFPENSLNEFLSELRRVLKPGGTLLLDDHNIVDEKSWLIAQAAHTMVNLIGNEPLAVEKSELRNFKPMSEWAALLQKYDLCPQDLSTLKVRKGDASNNAMLALTKSKKLSLDKTDLLNQFGLLKCVHNQASPPESALPKRRLSL